MTLKYIILFHAVYFLTRKHCLRNKGYQFFNIVDIFHSVDLGDRNKTFFDVNLFKETEINLVMLFLDYTYSII